MKRSDDLDQSLRQKLPLVASLKTKILVFFCDCWTISFDLGHICSIFLFQMKDREEIL